jgi:hypothetical protein
MVLHGIVTEAADQIKMGALGTFLMNDPDSNGYYVVEWTSLPYTLQEEAITLEEYDPPLHLGGGRIGGLCNG